MSTRHIRAMTRDDIEPVVALITDVDDEDGEEAAGDFGEHGVEGHFVVTLGDDPTAAGVCGFRHVPATERTSWLSWTYLARAHRGEGHGRALIEHVVAHLRGIECRKVFVKVSDYVDPDEGPLYEAAVKTYRSLGFARELTALDFHDAGENLMIYGLALAGSGPASTGTALAERRGDPGNGAGDGAGDEADATFPSAGEDDADAAFAGAGGGDAEPLIAEERPAIEFVGLHEIDDSDGAYTFEWTVGRKSLFGKRGSFGQKDLMLGLEGVRRAGGRKVFLTFPSNLPDIREPLRLAGFERIGQLQDYYERGLHELHFSHDLTGVP